MFVHLLLSFYIPHAHEIIWYLTSSDLFCLIRYSQDLSMLLQVSVFPLPSWLSSISRCIWTTSSLSSHLLKDNSIVFTSWPSWIMPQWPWRCIYLCQWMFSKFSGRDSKERLLGHMVTLFLIFWGASILFSIVAVSFSMSTSSEWG